MVKPWTTAEERVIRDNYKELTYKEMALLLPLRSAQAINHHLLKIGLSKKVWTPELSVKAQYLRSLGIGYQEIADRLGLKDRKVVDRHFQYLYEKANKNGQISVVTP